MDENTPFWPTTLPLPLEGGRPRVLPLSWQTEMDSGRIRKRRTAVEPRKLVEVSWNFTEDQFDEFKSFYEDTLVNGSSTFAMFVFGTEKEVAFAVDQYNFTRSDNVFNVNSILHIIGNALGTWDFTACEVDLLTHEGGGDNFDCYPTGTYPDLLFQSGFRELDGLAGGTGFSDSFWQWEKGDFAPGTEDFDAYPVTGLTAGNMNDGTGWATGWIHANTTL